MAAKSSHVQGPYRWCAIAGELCEGCIPGKHARFHRHVDALALRGVVDACGAANQCAAREGSLWQSLYAACGQLQV